MATVKLTLIILLLVATFQVTSQIAPITISGKINSNDLEKIEVVKYGLRSHLKVSPDFEIDIKKDNTFSGKFIIPGMGFYRIGDGYFGHKVFLQPGDSVFIELNKVANLEDRMAKGEFFKKFHVMTVKSKYPKNLTFFDEIDERFKLPIKYSQGYKSADEYQKKLLSVYQKEQALLNDYELKKMVSPDFVKYATVELNAHYILQAGEIFSNVPRSAIPDQYFSLPFEMNLSDSDYAVSTDSYITAASLYNIYFANKLHYTTSYTDLNNEFKNALTNFTGIVRDRLIGWSIEDYADKNYPGYDSIYNLFLQRCNNQVIKNSVIKKVAQKQELVKSKQKARDENKISFVNAVNETFVEDLDGKKVRLRTLFPENKITVIDCWASWCGPCIDQIPHIDEIEKEYKTKVNFLYLSFDKDAIKWKDAINKYKSNSNNEYIIHNDFDSFFSNYFDLETIPRYILIGKNGAQVLDDNMIRPSDQTGFKEVLDNYLKK